MPRMASSVRAGPGLKAPERRAEQMAEVHEIADGIFRIATFIPEANITFNQFLIADETPLLFHTGQRLLFPLTLEAVRQVIDPTRLRYITWTQLGAAQSGV